VTARASGTAGLGAVARVRGVRERDSRLGLVQALAEVREREADVRRLEDAVRAHGSFVSGDMATFVALRQSLAALRHEASESRRRLESAQGLAVDADSRWRTDRTRLGAVEGLIERREAEERAERARIAARDLDEVATQAWLRRTGEESA